MNGVETPRSTSSLSTLDNGFIRATGEPAFPSRSEGIYAIDERHQLGAGSNSSPGHSP